MKFIKNRFAPWPIVLLIGVAVLAISLAARVSPSTMAVDREDHLVQQPANTNEDGDTKHSEVSEIAVGRGIARRQDYYDRRREYWENRVDRRLDDEESDDETGDDKDDTKKDSKDAKDEKADKDDAAESDLDKEEEVIERRREYWRDRLDREW